MKKPAGTLIAMALSFAFAVPSFAHSDHWKFKGYEWSIVDGDDNVEIAVSPEGHARIKGLRGELDEPFVWVRKRGEEWVITDRALIRELRDIMEEPEYLREIELELEYESEALEESMRDFERRVERIESEIGEVSIRAALELAEAATELKVEELERAAERLGERASVLGRWAEELEERIEEEAIPLIEEAIRSGKSRRVR